MQRTGRRSDRADRRIVAALAATTTAGYGVLFYSYGVLLVPMERDLGWSRSVLTGAFSGALLVSALMTVPVGRWLDRHPPRALMTVGGVVATVLVVCWGLAPNPLVFYLVWTGLGACMAVLFYEPAFTLLTKRFRGAERHRAVTTVTLLAGLASTIFGPLTAVLERALGWRGAVFALSALLGAVSVPLFAVALAPQRGPAPASQEQAQAETHNDAVPREAMASRRFWCLTGAYLLSAVTTFAVAVHLVPYLRSRGWGSGAAATALGAVGLVQVAGRSTFARLTLRLPPARLGTWVLLAKAVGIALLLVVPSVAGVVGLVVVYGAANGLATLTRATVVADLYGAQHYGAIPAVVGAVSAVGGALAPFAFAAAVEVVHGTVPVLWGLVAVSVVASAAHEVAIAGRPGRARESGVDVDLVAPLEVEG